MRKYGALQLLVPLAQQPLSAKINSAPTIFQKKCVHVFNFTYSKTSAHFIVLLHCL